MFARARYSNYSENKLELRNGVIWWKSSAQFQWSAFGALAQQLQSAGVQAGDIVPYQDQSN